MTLKPTVADRLGQRRSARLAQDATPGGAVQPDDRPCVLVIDDEPEITRSVAELLGRDYRVLTASSADEGLAVLASDQVAVILTDQRMPDGTGAELLARSVSISPETTRILFTGYSDISAVIDAVNEGQVYRYIAKPWQPEQLREVVADGLARHDLVVENRRLLEDLTRAHDDLALANREIREIAYAIAHDVRSPLRAIDGFAALVARDARPVLPEASLGHLDRVREAAQRMGVLIDELLAFSQVSRKTIVREEVDLSAMAESIIADLREAEPSRRVEAVVTPGLTVQADRTLLHAIASNLIANAWKFTAGREIGRIEVGVTDVDGERAFFVRDNGIGFDPRDATRLFGVFERLHPAGEYEGEGIGLATVQRLVARHGGRVWAEAGVDTGATFRFTLPLASGGLP